MLLRTTLAGLISVQAITLPESYHEIGVDKIQACGKLENFFNENNPASQHFTEIEKYPLYNYQVVYQTTKKGRSGLYVKCKRVKKRKVSAADWTAFKNWKATEIWRNRTARFLCDRKGNWKIKRNIPTCANFTGSDNGWDSLLNPVEAPVLDNDALFQNEAANSNDGSFDDTPPIDNRQYITAGQTCNTENGGVDRWTDWASRDNGGQSGTGEYEQLFRLLDEKPEIVNCTAPIGVKARKVDINDVTDIWYQSHRFGPDYGFVCQNVNHPDNLCDDVELSFCCSGCGELFENCQVCLADNSGCFEYSKDYTTQQVEEQFSYLGTTSGCSTCNKCVVTAADNTGNNPFPTVTAHYPEGSSTPSNVDLKGYPEAGCAFRTYFDQQYDELWLEYEVYFPADFDFVKGGKMPGLFGGSVYSGCNLPDGTNGFSTRYMWGENSDMHNK